MSVNVKVIFTLGTIAVAIAFILIKSNADNAGSDWWWKGGKTDLIRNLLFHPNGSLRRHTKVTALTYFGLFLLLLWFVIPTASAPH